MFVVKQRQAKRFVRLALAIHVCLLTSFAHSNTAGNKTSEALSLSSGSAYFSCNLKSIIGQCRYYEVLDAASETIDELKEGCISMRGKVSGESCPKTDLVGQCMAIVRNYNQPDTVYDNYYYRDGGAQWNHEKLQRVCDDLGGDAELK